MDIRLDGRVALVTGSDSGIGEGIAVCLAESGADVVVHYYSDQKGAEATADRVRAAGRQAIVVQGDVGVRADVERMFAELDAAFGTIDILVSNAGVGKGGPFVELDPADFMRVMDINFYGGFHCMQLAGQRMVQQGKPGRMIAITSVHEEAPSLNGSAYHASKGAMRNLVRSVALDLGRHGITVNAIAPGMILTPMNQRAKDDPEYLAEAAAQIPLLRAGLPEDIAHMACFLASDQASYCTGATYFVDGGWMLNQPPV